MAKTIYAFGDIHGCFTELNQLYNEVLDDIVINKFNDVEIVFVGDYIDRGPHSKRVLDFLMSLSPGGVIKKFTFLKGNHEDMLLTDVRSFLYNGGKQTLESFGVEFASQIPEQYMDWFKRLPTAYETDDYIFVHAGLEPEKTLQETKDYSRVWIREEFLESDWDWGKLIIHGHTPIFYETGNFSKDQEFSPIIRANRINIDTGCVYKGKLTAVRFVQDNPIPHFIQV